MVESASAIVVVVSFPEGVPAIDICVRPAIFGLESEGQSRLHQDILLVDRAALGREYRQLHLGKMTLIRSGTAWFALLSRDRFGSQYARLFRQNGRLSNEENGILWILGLASSSFESIY